MKQSLAIIGAMIGAEACGGTFQDVRRISPDYQEAEPVITDSVVQIAEMPQSLEEIRRATRGGTRAVMDPTGMVHVCTPNNWIKEIKGTDRFVPPLYIPRPGWVDPPFEEHTKGAAELALKLGYHNALCEAAKIENDNNNIGESKVELNGRGACLSTSIFPAYCDSKLDIALKDCDDLKYHQSRICVNDSGMQDYADQREMEVGVGGDWTKHEGNLPSPNLVSYCNIVTNGTFSTICEQFVAQREYAKRKRAR